MPQQHKFPEEYRPLAYCRACGKDFSGDSMFDAHRVGVQDYTYQEGASIQSWTDEDWKRLLPEVKVEERAALAQEPREDGRRCMTDEEMREKGWRPATDEEMLDSHRDKHRVGFGVELWIDPARREELRAYWQKRKEAEEA